MEFHNFLKEENQRRKAAYLLPYEINSGFVKHLEVPVSRKQPIRWRALSVSAGQAKVVDLQSQVPRYWHPVCQQVQAAFGLRVFAIDFILSQGTPHAPQEYYILEVKGNPMLNSLAPNPDFATTLWKEILTKWFPTNTPI